jgi:23S rRNA A1618 N6-methylase RlmF
MTITIDDFLGGKVKLAQSKDGYRSTSDSVLLASAVLAKDGEHVLDVGTGNGVVLFCLAARVPDLKMTGIDVQSDLLDLALKNNELNNQEIRFVLDDVSKKETLIHGEQFHHVVTNPPFYRDGRGRMNEQQRIAFIEKYGAGNEAGIHVQRYKGLGEMNEEQLRQTTMCKEGRTLRQITIENAAAADHIFSMLMGDDVEPRREFIEANATYARIDA